MENLRSAEAADRLAFHVASAVEKAIDMFPEKERAQVGAEITGRLLRLLATETAMPAFVDLEPALPPQVLRAVLGTLPDGSLERINAPLIPLLDTTLLTNARGEPSLSHQLQTEVASADRIDVIMAFVRRSGIVPLREQLRRHCESGRAVRLITTTYTGSTELEALELLREIGVQVRISYDTTGTRLHAKSWLFHRDSGFSTAYVGSSNLTHSAQVSGLEWNVRVSGARNRSVLEKISAAFESYWVNPDYQEFATDRFAVAIAADNKSRPHLSLSPIEVTLWPFQERLLEQVDLAREEGHHRNLLVSATGTGKTVMAAVDYARLRLRLDRSRLLFVAHRQEILEQSLATFAHVLRDASFGELWVAGRRPDTFEHVFASIQSLNAQGLSALDPKHFDVVIVDEFHHAAAASYERLLQLLEPTELLGLTATPERGDGQSVLHWFGGRIAAELRLWDAIDQSRLTPFAYYGVADDLDLSEIPWKRGTGYDTTALTTLITGTDIWARSALNQVRKLVGAPDKMRALGFCVSVDHAKYMARVFQHHGVAAVTVSGETPESERRAALADLEAARVNAVFSVDLFNEGIDVPSVDTLLMLRPTESPLLFLQQLGRGLRKTPTKSLCTVLDFVGQHRREFRYDRRFQALLGGSRRQVVDQIEQGFPFLPAGCYMELDRVAKKRVLENIKRAVPTLWKAKAAELQAVAAQMPDLTLGAFLLESGLDLDDVYSGSRSWSDLKEAASLEVLPQGEAESVLRKACGRLMHIDDHERLDAWRGLLRLAQPPDALSPRERRLVTMLLSQLLDQIAERETTLEQGLRLLWQHPQVRAEVVELLDVLAGRIPHLSVAVDGMPNVPLRVHARYTRHEILGACGVTHGVAMRSWREGVLFAEGTQADILVFTLDKTSGQFSPTTRFRDYAISRDLIHWETQSATRSDSPTGQRYQHHQSRGSHILLFARVRSGEPFYFLGPATYVSHRGEMPMAITWKLKHPLPGDIFAAFAAAVA